LGRHARRRPPHRERLEREPDLEQVAKVVDVERLDARALVRDVLGEAERLELPHRLPDRRDAHAERPRELIESERGPRLELAHDDRLAQLIERVLGHRAMAEAAALGVPGRLHPLAREAHTRLITCQTLCEDLRNGLRRPAGLDLQISTFSAPFADDVAAYVQ